MLLLQAPTKEHVHRVSEKLDDDLIQNIINFSNSNWGFTINVNYNYNCECGKKVNDGILRYDKRG